MTTRKPCPDCGGTWRPDGKCAHAVTCPLVRLSLMAFNVDEAWFRVTGLKVRVREIYPVERVIFNWREIQVPEGATMIVSIGSDGTHNHKFTTAIREGT